MSVSRRGVDVLMDCCRPPVVAGLPLQQKDPGTCGLRGARVVRLAGRTQHHVLCAPNHSLLDSCDSCGNARGRLARRPRFERFVTLLYHCHLYLARAESNTVLGNTSYGVWSWMSCMEAETHATHVVSRY